MTLCMLVHFFLLRDGRRRLAKVLDRLQGRVIRNAATARFHARRPWTEHPS